MMVVNGEVADIVAAAMEQILADEALYQGLTDRESTILAQWANGRIGLALAGATDARIARYSVELEVERLSVAFKAITKQVDMMRADDRGLVIAFATAILSEVWNAGK